MSYVESDALNEIINGCKNNNQKSQKHLYEKYSKQMVALCFRYTSDYEEARDLMHDGFIKIFSNIGSYSGIGSFEGWMKRVFVNISLDYIKKQPQYTDIEVLEYTEIEKNDFILEEEDDISIEDIYNAIKELPNIARTVFNLFNIEGYSISEISQELNMTNVAVRSQHHRAKEKLKEILKRVREKD